MEDTVNWSHEHADGYTYIHPSSVECDLGTPTRARVREDANAEPIMRFFEYAHLPAHLQEVSRPFSDLAHQLQHTLDRSPERTVALRKLLESKDAAVRAAL